jgi:hypothetical protein
MQNQPQHTSIKQNQMELASKQASTGFAIFIEIALLLFEIGIGLFWIV